MAASSRAGQGSDLELDEIQGLLLRGFGDCPHARFLFLRIRDLAAARVALAALADELALTSTAARLLGPRAESRVQLAFTARGLRALGLDDDALDSFPLEFQEGIATPDRARILGDTGDSAPEVWEFGGRGDGGDGGIDVWLGLYARGAEPLRVLRADWADSLAGFDVIAEQHTIPREGDREHFGFRDGISQPAIEGDPAPLLPGQDLVRAGEFVLGYPNQYGKLPLSPSVAASSGAGAVGLPAAAAPGRHDLGRNGSFLVYRKLEQHVDAFKAFFAAAAERESGRPDRALADYLAAKCMGRWPSGAPLMLAPERDDPALGADPLRNNDFRFADTDPRGLRCPIASHIRRANPRDAKGPDPAESLEVVQRHRLLRRGRMYHEPSGRRGVHFLALNASLRRQFEFIQQTWIINPKFEGLHADRDPITGDSDPHARPEPGREPPVTQVTIPEHPYRRRLGSMPRFVSVRAGAYLFMPGLRTLRWLATPGAG